MMVSGFNARQLNGDNPMAHIVSEPESWDAAKKQSEDAFREAGVAVISSAKHLESLEEFRFF